MLIPYYVKTVYFRASRQQRVSPQAVTQPITKNIIFEFIFVAFDQNASSWSVYYLKSIVTKSHCWRFEWKLPVCFESHLADDCQESECGTCGSSSVITSASWAEPLLLKWPKINVQTRVKCLVSVTISRRFWALLTF